MICPGIHAEMSAEDKQSSPISRGDPNGEDRDSTDVGEQSELLESAKDKSNGDGSKATQKTNVKDPSRPRRKKARRACFACQRAHLTCGMFM